MLHLLVHFFEALPFVVEILVLCRENLLVIVQKVAEIIELRVLQHLETVKSGGDFFRWRYFLHLVDRLGQQVVLPLDQGIVVLEQVLQLLHTCQVAVLAVTALVHIICITVFTLVEQTHRRYLLINSIHELTQSLEVEFKLSDEFFARLFKRRVEKIVTNQFQLVLQSLFRFCRFFMRAIFCFKALRKDVLFEADYVKHLSLKLLQTLFKVLILLTQLFVNLLLIATYHQLELRIR